MKNRNFTLNLQASETMMLSILDTILKDFMRVGTGILGLHIQIQTTKVIKEGKLLNSRLFNVMVRDGAVKLLFDFSMFGAHNEWRWAFVRVGTTAGTECFLYLNERVVRGTNHLNGMFDEASLRIHIMGILSEEREATHTEDAD